MKKCALKDLKTLKICRCGEIKNRIDMSSRLTRDSYRVKTAKLVNKTFCSREWNWNRISSLTRDAISHATRTSPKKQYRRWTERESRTSGWLKRTDPPLTPVVSFAIVVSQVRSISVSAVTWCCDTNGNKCRGVLSAPYTCATVRQSAFICRARPTHANSCPSNIEPSTMHVSSSLSLSFSLSLSLCLSFSLLLQRSHRLAGDSSVKRSSSRNNRYDSSKTGRGISKWSIWIVFLFQMNCRNIKLWKYFEVVV